MQDGRGDARIAQGCSGFPALSASPAPFVYLPKANFCLTKKRSANLFSSDKKTFGEFIFV
ncbi:hypothetical protein A5N86_17390 [Geobacillus thermoleovorans]|nr:hypothetical protein A5N86_17395 [Geobacillus thermoleovorans]ODA18152.1 hypothetical protein A5N86_17390 [Geobacillus thermoleovorans]